MIKKIINWTFGSFFRTLGRIFLYILLAILISYLLKDFKIPKIDIWQILDVHANTVDLPYYDNGLDNIGGARVYNWTSSSSHTELNTSVEVKGLFSQYSYQDKENLGLLNGYFYGIKDTSVSNFGSNGVSIALLLENIVLVTNSYYSTTAYLCTQNNPTINVNNIYVATGYNNSFNYPVTYKKQILSQNIQDSFDPIDYNGLNYCKMINFIYRPAYDGSVLNIRLTSSDSVGDWYLVGTQTKMIADASNITSSDVSNAINNSGLASASSVNEVQSSINQVQSQLNSSTNTIVNNQNSNKQEIITNANSNSQAEIQNANENTDRTIDSQKVCTNDNITTETGTINGTTGLPIDNTSPRTRSEFIKVISNTEYTIKLLNNINAGIYVFEYDNNKNFIDRIPSDWTNNNYVFTTKSNAKYIRIALNNDTITNVNVSGCKNGNQAMNDSINDMNSTINNSDSSQATNDAGSFFNNFSTNTHGLTGIITAPLSAIQSLTSSTCESLVLPLPFVNQDLTLPCMRDIYIQYFGNFMQLYDIITLGIISYWVMVRIFALVKDFKNPEHDEIEVVDL